MLEEEEAATALFHGWEKPAGALWCDVPAAQAGGDQEEACFSVLFDFSVETLGISRLLKHPLCSPPPEHIGRGGR